MLALCAVVAAMTPLLTGCAVAIPHQVAILVETFDAQYVSIPRMVSVNVIALDKNGNVGRWFDPQAPVDANSPDGDKGIWKPYPLRTPVTTPWSHSQTVLPGEATTINLTAVLIGRPGDHVVCSVYVDGVVQPHETNDQVVQAYVGAEVAGSAVTQCQFSYVNQKG